MATQLPANRAENEYVELVADTEPDMEDEPTVKALVGIPKHACFKVNGSRADK